MWKSNELTHFWPMFPIYTPENIRKPLVFHVFRGYKIRSKARNGLIFKTDTGQKCPYSEFFWSVSSRIRIEYGDIRSISPYSVRIWENTDQKNSKYEHFSRNESWVGTNFIVQVFLLLSLSTKWWLGLRHLKSVWKILQPNFFGYS